MLVTIGETGKDGAPIKIDNPRCTTQPRSGRRIRADKDDDAVFYGNGFVAYDRRIVNIDAFIQWGVNVRVM